MTYIRRSMSKLLHFSQELNMKSIAMMMLLESNCTVVSDGCWKTHRQFDANRSRPQQHAFSICRVKQLCRQGWKCDISQWKLYFYPKLHRPLQGEYFCETWQQWLAASLQTSSRSLCLKLGEIIKSKSSNAAAVQSSVVIGRYAVVTMNTSVSLWLSSTCCQSMQYCQ